MNTIEKIVAESRTQKEAVAKITALRDAVAEHVTTIPSEIEISQAVKDLKNGRTTVIATDVVGIILAAEKKRNLARTKESLEKRSPADLLQKAVDDLDKNLNDWFEKAKADPFYQLSWGGKAFELAASRKTYLEIRHDMDRGGWTKARWEAVLAGISKEVLSMASQSGSSRSSSKCSNLAEDCLMEAKAKIAKGDDWSISEITWWYKEKEKFDRDWAEVHG